MGDAAMATQRIDKGRKVAVAAHKELIAIPDEIDGQQVVRYFASDEEADAAFGPDSVAEALSLMGAWSDLDWDETVEELDRIRHESKPTPPIDNLFDDR
jgi:hypothetical protein